MKKKKGFVDAIFMTVFIFIWIFIFGALAMNNAAKQDDLSIAQRDTLVVKDTFSLFNKSLDATWSFSTTQALFASAEHGFELSSMFGENVKDAYWYRFHPSDSLELKLPSGQDNKDIPNRCNQPGGNPGICLPQSKNVENFLDRSMNEIWFDLSSKKPYVVLENPVKVKIEKKDDRLDIVALKLWPAQDRIIYQIATHVAVEGYRSNINTYAVSSGYIETNLPKMIKIGWLAVGISTQLRWEAGKPNNDFLYTTDTTASSQIKSTVDRFFRQNTQDISNAISNDPSNKFFMEINPKIDFKVPASEQPQGISKGGGLLLHYDADVTIQEGTRILNIGPSTVLSGDCSQVEKYKEEYKKYEPYITNNINSPKSSLRSLTDSGQALIAGIITQESAWNPRAVSSAGASGLMQVMPATALGDCGLSSNELADYDRNIACGVLVLSKYSQAIEKSVKQNSDKTNIIKLSLAAYNCGIGCVQSLISSNGPRYEDIESHLPDETKNYVEKVLGYFASWQNCIGYGKPVINDKTKSSLVNINYKKSRTSQIDSIVIGQCGASYDKCIKNLQENNIGAHYVIAKTGEISQLVKDEDTAKEGFYYQDRAIFIEVESSDPAQASDWTPQLKDSLANLLKYLSNKHGIQKTHPANSAPLNCCDNSCGINEKGILGIGQICPSIRSGPEDLSFNALVNEIRKEAAPEVPVIKTSQSCAFQQDIGKYICRQDSITSRYYLHKCSFTTGYKIDLATAENLRPFGITRYPCFRSDCSDCLNQVIENTISDIENYRRDLEEKSRTVVSLSDNYCEDRDDPDSARGYSNLAYDLSLQRGSKVISAYDGDIIYSANIQPSYFGACGGIVMIKTGDTIISYSNLVPSSAGATPDKSITVKKGDVIGTVANCDKPHIELRLFKDSFSVPSLENSKNICGNPTNCNTYGHEGLPVSISGFIPRTPLDTRAIPYWCSSIKWPKSSQYHETIVPVESKNIRYDEENNLLKRESFAIKFSLEDWIPVLNCQGNDDKRYGWQSPEDMICQSGKLYSCEREIPGIDSQKLAKGSQRGNYKCVLYKSSTEFTPRFCKRIDLDGIQNTGDYVQTQEDGKDNVCCKAWVDPNAWKIDNGGYCQGDGYCSDNEQNVPTCPSPDCDLFRQSLLASGKC